VPNGTHVLNAHLVSVAELWATHEATGDAQAKELALAGIQTLKGQLARFDTGYCLKYDQNPKKELLFQLDWLSAHESPAIDAVYLENPQTGLATMVDVGAAGDGEGPGRIGGTDWLVEEATEGRSVRRFRDGYAVREVAEPGAARHNAFVTLALPRPLPEDWFDLPPHRLVVRYRDTAPGRFVVKVQAIHEGRHLAFVPLRDGVLRTVGDGAWKEAVFLVRPQDLGWFKGVDYQEYEVGQLQRLAELSGDWFFAQYAARQRGFLERVKAGLSPLVAGEAAVARMRSLDPRRVLVERSSATAEGAGFENALDGDLVDDYVAGVDGTSDHFVELDLGAAQSLIGLRVDWLDGENRAETVRLYADGGKTPLPARAIRVGSATSYWLAEPRSVRRLRLEFGDFVGQPRVLLRGLSFYPATAAGRETARR
jgi:hypothetical protein